MNNKYIVFLIILILSYEITATTPSISNITGTISPGQSIIISGSNLIDQDTTDWDWTESNSSFEGTSYTDDGYVIGGCPNGCNYSTSTKLLGNKSFESQVALGGGATCPGGVAYYSDNIYSNLGQTNGYMRAYIRFDENMADVWSVNRYFKLIYWRASCNIVIDFVQTIWATQIYVGTHDYTETFNLPQQLAANKWYSFEIQGDTITDTTRIWFNGVLVGTISHALNGDTCQYLSVVGINACAESEPPLDGKMYVDGFVQSSSRVYPAAIVEVSDNVVYASGNKVIQDVQTLSDSSVAIDYKESGYDLTGTSTTLEGTERYLWITNNKQERSSGFELTLDETAPTASSASILADGTHVRLNTSEAVQFGAGGTGGGAMTGCSGGVTTLGTPSANGSYVEWPITNRTVYKDETSCVLAYTQPTDGLQDTATTPNDMATFADLEVTTNNGPALSVGTPSASMSNSNGSSAFSNTNGFTTSN